MELYDLIIIGNGPAGLSAAIYGKRAGMKTLVISGNPSGGGQILDTYEIDNYPGMPGLTGAELGEAFFQHANKLGTEFSVENVKSITEDGAYKIVKTRKNEYKTKVVVVATGAGHRKLGAPGEAEFTGMGVSYCATCDGAFYKDKTVAVVGGGDVALEDAIYLSDIANKVYLIHRRDEFRGTEVLQDEVFSKDNIEVVYDTVLDEILGENAIEKIIVSNKKTNEKKELSVDGVFIAVGITPNTTKIEGLPETDEAGYIKAGEDCVTSIPGIYAAGDVRTKMLRQVITAAADGANAITSAKRYISSLKA
ncbi:MAG: thioredoxin-disulfide reductase [Lachnospiraceae bacterium]|nr:thioredoxin-disulfide reductase [Lachnospiraceae bacterium]